MNAKPNFIEHFLVGLSEALIKTSLHPQCIDCIYIMGSSNGPVCDRGNKINVSGNCSDYNKKETSELLEELKIE